METIFIRPSDLFLSVVSLAFFNFFYFRKFPISQLHIINITICQFLCRRKTYKKRSNKPLRQINQYLLMILEKQSQKIFSPDCCFGDFCRLLMWQNLKQFFFYSPVVFCPFSNPHMIWFFHCSTQVAPYKDIQVLRRYELLKPVFYFYIYYE